MLQVSRNVTIWLKQVKLNPNIIQFISRMNIWASQLSLLKLLRSLEGRARVQQNNNWLLL